jgi:hypothetical protein
MKSDDLSVGVLLVGGRPQRGIQLCILVLEEEMDLISGLMYALTWRIVCEVD